MAFFCVFLLQCLQMDADSDHQRSGNHGEDRGTDKSNEVQEQEENIKAEQSCSTQRRQ